MTHQRIYLSARGDSYFSAHPATLHQHPRPGPDLRSLTHNAVKAGLMLVLTAVAVVTGVVLLTAATTAMPVALLAHVAVQIFSRHGGYV